MLAQNGAQVSISGTKMLGNGSGVFAYGTTATTTTVIVSDSIVSGGSEGVRAYATLAGAIARIFVTRCTIEGTTIALDSETNSLGSALVSVSGSMITNNFNAWYQFAAGSVVKSLGNNHMLDNTSTFGVLTPASLQ